MSMEKETTSGTMENLSVITISLDLDAAEKHTIMRDIQQAVDRAVVRLPGDLLEKPQLEELPASPRAVIPVAFKVGLSSWFLTP